jgi:L-2-hydroxycarboxylate dehydrogenase (NAD+)
MIIAATALHQLCVEVLQRHRVPSGDSDLVAAALVDANLCGFDSHGVIRLPLWSDGLKRRTINSRPSIRRVLETEATALIDGDYGLGPVVGEYARKLVQEKAQRSGIAVVSVRHASHLSMLSFYGGRLALAGLIGLIVTNTEAAMAPFGGRDRVLGSNPLCVAVPGREFPIILDISSSIVARGKLLVAQANGDTIPDTWALDADGHPTTDPRAALDGALRPIAGHKGSGLAVVIDLLSGALAGAAVTTGVRGTYQMQERSTKGDAFIAINPAFLAGEHIFKALTDKAVADIVGSRTAPGTKRIFAPGEIEHERRKERLRKGIPLPDELIQQLRTLATA